MRALDISSDNVASRTLLDHGQGLGKITTKDARNATKQCATSWLSQEITQRTVDGSETGLVLHRYLIPDIQLVLADKISQLTLLRDVAPGRLIAAKGDLEAGVRSASARQELSCYSR